MIELQQKNIIEKEWKIFFEGIELANSNAKINFEKNHKTKYNDL